MADTSTGNLVPNTLAPDALGARQEGIGPENDATISAQPFRILVIDDDPGLRGLLTALFHREGWTVETAADGQSAVQQMALVQPDVVILDLMLPKLMGLEVLQQITAQDATCSRRVLVVTAVSAAELRRLPAGLDVWQVIRKPFDNAELLRSVQACGSRQAPPRPRPGAKAA